MALRMVAASTGTLQWGRATKGAEGTAWTATSRAARRCFKGAAPLRARRDLDILEAEKILFKLQWGRTPKGAEGA